MLNDYKKKQTQTIMYSIKTTKNENPLLNQVVISNENLNLKSIIYPNLGAAIQELSVNNVSIIDGITNDQAGLDLYKTKFNSSFLFPFPNRVKDGKYSFENKDYLLEVNETNLNNRLHGHIFNKSFSVKSQKVSEKNASVTFSYSDNGTSEGFPFPYEIEITYSFSNSNMSIDFNVLNIGKTSFPYGIGWHPYFNAKNLGTSVINFNADNQYVVDEQMIPKQETPLKFKTPLELGDTFLDDCFITKESNVSFKTDEYDINIDFSSKTPNSFLQFYTPDTRDCIAIEPMTCAPNSVNNKDGLLTLAPKENYSWNISLNF